MSAFMMRQTIATPTPCAPTLRASISAAVSEVTKETADFALVRSLFACCFAQIVLYHYYTSYGVISTNQILLCKFSKSILMFVLLFNGIVILVCGVNS